MRRWLECLVACSGVSVIGTSVAAPHGVIARVLGRRQSPACNLSRRSVRSGARHPRRRSCASGAAPRWLRPFDEAPIGGRRRVTFGSRICGLTYCGWRRTLYVSSERAPSFIELDTARFVALRELHAFVSRAETLRDEDWRRPTPCVGWTVGDLVEHVAGVPGYDYFAGRLPPRPASVMTLAPGPMPPHRRPVISPPSWSTS